MKSLVSTAAALVGALCVAQADAQLLEPPKVPSVLVPYTRCQFAGGLAANSVNRAPILPMSRRVETATGQQRVSVADGYMLMLAFRDADPFVNLKIERSMEGQYSEGKRAVLSQMQQMSANSRGAEVKLERSMVKGIDIAALNNPSLDGNIVSFYSLFDDKRGIIATAYILNQVPERRSFQNMEQFRAQKDAFIKDLASCMAALGQEK